MALRPLQYPDAVRETLWKRYQNQHRDWLTGHGKWPMALSLGVPSEEEATKHFDVVSAWVKAWSTWSGPGEITWHERQWRRLGTQRLPERLNLRDPAEVATLLGDGPRWERAQERFRQLVARWPRLEARLPRHFSALADYSAADFDRLVVMLAWLEGHPNSDLYPRQLPIAGIDSKWIEARKSLIVDLLLHLRSSRSEATDFYVACGLRPLPTIMRLRILDMGLRWPLGGLTDIAAPVEDLAKLDLKISNLYIVENLQSGMAFGDLPRSVVIMGLGYSVDLLANLPWVVRAKSFYWGDIDTHGFAILNRARSYITTLESLLMDEETLVRHKELWGEEREQHSSDLLPLLTDAEQAVYQGLKQGRWGRQVRLEQERVTWEFAWQKIVAQAA